ncbi:hypothetical protein B9W73_02555 [Lactococcus lactis]|uniref:hypothetical protein n=1 Tax=Lactococcus lactis TaxID=1358 RepID=UPI000A1EFD97|nr:hypothetical protein [Lactococcus lactis]OSP88234.1 hypothetical protein B9W73_02555 [Lactococcus lactis]
MNDKKYYVKLKNTYKHDERLLSLNKVSGKIDFVDWRNSGAWWKGTKSELAEIMGGAIYKSKFRHETQDELWRNGWTIRADKVNGCTHWEWINPLIELVPVEDGE